MQSSITREEHIVWCKLRAYKYLEEGNFRNAIACLQSDLSKHPTTESHAAIEISYQLQMNGDLQYPDQIRKFIAGVY